MRLRLVVPLLVLATSVVGCQGGTDDPAAWIAEQDHVADVVEVPWGDADDESDGGYLRITLDDGLDDEQVLDLVQDVKEHFDDEADVPSMEVDVDGFVSSIYPAVIDPAPQDPDLLRALWLREDGRATAYGDRFRNLSGSHPLVTAPAPVVAQLALDFDAAVSHADDVRQSYSVESADGTTGVEWTASEGLGFTIPTEEVETMAALQQRYPGTTGWIASDGGPPRALLRFDPDDLGLDPLLEQLPDLVDPAGFEGLEVGWGPARAPVGQLARFATDPADRALLDALVDVPGVRDLADGTVTVSDGASYDAVQRVAATTSGARRLTIALERRPVLYGFPVEPVFSSDERRGPFERARRAVADLDGVAGLDVSPAVTFGNLSVRADVDDDTLRAVLTSVAGLPSPYERTEVYVVTTTELGRDALGYLATVADDGTVTAQDSVDPGLAARVTEVWDDVAPARR